MGIECKVDISEADRRAAVIERLLDDPRARGRYLILTEIDGRLTMRTFKRQREAFKFWENLPYPESSRTPAPKYVPKEGETAPVLY